MKIYVILLDNHISNHYIEGKASPSFCPKNVELGL